jgi:hypothetical protein
MLLDQHGVQHGAGISFGQKSVTGALAAGQARTLSCLSGKLVTPWASPPAADPLA